MRLFIYKDGVLSLNKDEVLLYPALRKLITRDKGSPGDSTGTKKLQAFKEFAYIYFVCDYNSYPNVHGFSAEETHRHAVDHAELPPDWTPHKDEDLVNAMDFYYVHHESVPRELYKALLASFKNSTAVVTKMNNEIEKILKKSLLSAVEITTLHDMQQSILDIATKLPKQLNSLQEAMALIRKEEQSGEIARGGEMVADSMDPEKAIG